MEIELKYNIKDESVIKKIFQDSYIEQIKVLQTEETVEMDAVYFDTEERSLNQKGIAFRVRKEGNVFQATVKWKGFSKDGMHKREELNVPIDGQVNFQQLNLDVFQGSRLYEIVYGAVGSKPLVPLMEVSFLRRQVQINTGKSVSELSADRGQVRCGGKSAPILELEVELISGDEADMRILGDWLAEKYGLEEENISKFKRGLDLME